MANQHTEPACSREMAAKIVALISRDELAYAIFEGMRRGLCLTGINHHANYNKADNSTRKKKVVKS